MRAGKALCDSLDEKRASAPTFRSLSHLPEAVGKTFGGVDIANGDDELGPAIALRRHAEG